MIYQLILDALPITQTIVDHYLTERVTHKLLSQTFAHIYIYILIDCFIVTMTYLPHKYFITIKLYINLLLHCYKIKTKETYFDIMNGN